MPKILQQAITNKKAHDEAEALFLEFFEGHTLKELDYYNKDGKFLMSLEPTDVTVSKYRIWNKIERVLKMPPVEIQMFIGKMLAKHLNIQGVTVYHT
jgi:hypothetical protein